ncbi:MAG: hypothetical protein B6245_07995 [Desulfobacteraceae bacterium 4572_88]|nr:MAG: hypothetical protein B6245_07995 [Desulfobacteraceae bacterium 4572_88]
MNDKLSRQNVLIVDDAPQNIRVLELALRGDYEVTAATSGKDAIKLIASAESDNMLPDLILLDVMMPEMDGYEVCEILKQDSRTRNIPIIFITARNEEEEENKGFDLGAVDYITKPCSLSIVRARAKTHLDLKLHRDHLEYLVRARTAELKESHDELEQRVAERTDELMAANTRLKDEIKKQEISINLAKNILNLVNGDSPRYLSLSNDRLLFINALSVPCYAEGGDHFFVRCLTDEQCRHRKTVISIKDQSGHEVSCVLRSIVTDLIHNAVLNNHNTMSLAQTTAMLNDEICLSNVFDKEDFFTALDMELDHETLKLRYVSAGHPPFLLIRGKTVRDLPGLGDLGSNLPIAVKNGMPYSAGEIQIQPGDKLILYTDGLVEMPLKNRREVITLDDLRKIVTNMLCSADHEHPQEVTVSDMMRKILNHITEFSEETIDISNKNRPINTSGDDVTILGLEIEDQSHYSEKIWHPTDADDIATYIVNLYEELETEWHRRGFEFPEQRIRMILEEAVLNAWTHGNKKAPDKAVTVRWRFGNDFHIEVIDEGPGFDYDKVPDPTLDENLIKPFGRGIFFIRYFCDDICWKKGGRHLVMAFRKHPDLVEKWNEQDTRITPLWELCKKR